jgi:AraC-like DNA-binding protein
MITFGPMSITLLICALQGFLLATLLLMAKHNQTANRYLALLIMAVAALITPFIIGYAGFYDKWPRLSFAPFSYTLAFGPLIYFYTISLVDTQPKRTWPHFIPVLIQFLADALVFPLPLDTKNWWDGVAHAPIISPLFEGATLLSIAAYGTVAYRRYQRYRRWLDDNRTDGVDFDPSWVRNFLIALAVVGLIWLGFVIANWRNPARNYFDQFWLYVTFSGLVIYLGIAGWRHSETAFPRPSPPEPEPLATPSADNRRNWAEQGQLWLLEIDRSEIWRDSELTLASLTRRLGTNTSYLSRGLNEAAGENFNAIINRRRVAAVQQWLASPTETRDILTLAFDAGFNSKASFNRAFADFVGVSPTAWRLKSQKMQVA